MKRISDKVKCIKISKFHYEIRIKRISEDNFGKMYINYEYWDKYTLKEQCEKASIDDLQSMVNCGYMVINGYRNGIAV